MKNAKEAMANAYVPGNAVLAPEMARLIERRDRLLGPAYRLMYNEPIHVVRGEGVWLHGPNGERYLDAYNNVTSLGHCHPRVVDAIRTQAGVLATNTRYLQEGILQLAEELLATMPEMSGQMMLTCTGSEANDLATRIAGHVTGGTGIIVTETAYHGITGTVAQYSPSLGPAVNLGQHVVCVPAQGDVGAEGVDGFGEAVRRGIAQLERHGIKPAMLIVDTLFTSDGVRSDPVGFLAPAVEAIRAAGGIFVADEVQPGFARTGSHFWGFQRHGVVPDIVTMGKPMGNGFPVAGLVARPEMIAQFGRDARYFNTFGGNSLACAAALAVLGVIRDDALQANAARMGQLLTTGMRDLAAAFPVIHAVRGAGLMIGVELRENGLPAPAQTAALVNGLRREGVLISAAGKDHNMLKIRPPLIVAEEHVRIILDRMKLVLGQL